MSAPSCVAQSTTPPPNLFLVSPADRELIERFSCHPRTPYRAGFEDCMYQHIYANPYPLRTDAWRRYESGHVDARAQQRVLL